MSDCRAAKQNYTLPISNGIIEHRQKIGSSIWLFILLIDWTTAEENGIGKVKGGKPIKLKELMEALTLKERQISSQLQRLKTGGYIRLRRNPYGYTIEVLKSKKFINRDRQKTTVLPFPAQQKVAGPEQQQIAGLNGEIGTVLPVQIGNFLPKQRRHYSKDIESGPSGDKHRCSLEDLQIDGDITSVLKAENIPIAVAVSELDRFKDYCRAKGKRFKDYSAAFRNWLRKAKEFQSANGNGQHQGRFIG